MSSLKFFSLVLLLANFSNAFSMQEKDFIKHVVEKGQTVYQIGRLYSVSPKEILKINPNAQDGLEIGEVVIVPKTGVAIVGAKPDVVVAQPVAAAPANSKTHVVAPKETLYSLSRTYNVTVADLIVANPSFANGLQIGQTVNIPASSGKVSSEKPVEKVIALKMVEKPATEKVKEQLTNYTEYEVAPGDTKWSIAKKHGISVETLAKYNPESITLSVGEKLKVPTATSSVVKPAVNVVKSVVEKPANVTTVLEIEDKQDVSVATTSNEIALNDPSKLYDRIINKPVLNDLLTSANKEIKKELVLLLPFNLSRIQGDTISSLKTQLNRDKFLNMTLDFYSGALMAIDSVGKLGLKINVRILDSEESQTNSSISKVIAGHDFSKVNGIIGPFRQTNIEIVAGALAGKNIPIISPLSKESSKSSFPNLYNSIPPTDVLRKALLNYVKEQNANVIAIVDAKKISVKSYLTANYKGIKFATVDETNNLVVQSLKDLLVAGKMNIVILETEKASLLLKTVNALTDESVKDFQINLATMDKNATFDHEEIPLSKLVKLKLHYPSITKENGKQNSSKFAKKYKKENTIFPNQYAVRGFDLTFDAILRLAQDIPFEQTVDKFATEYVENRFSYDKDLRGGYFNRGVYVLSYEDDYSIKELK